jgi:hypothetical protein
MGLSDESQYQNYHRVLSRAAWSGLAVSKILLGLLVLGADETLERRNGKHIRDKGMFRDAVRSSKKRVVHSYGLRWVSMMLLVEIPIMAWVIQPRLPN